MILCDTDIIIELYRNNNRIISELKKLGQENIAISIVTVGELFFGALNKSELKKIENDVKSLTVKNIDEEISVIFYSLMNQYSLSHKLGIPDALIASTAIANNIELFTLNLKHFTYIPELRLYKFS